MPKNYNPIKQMFFTFPHSNVSKVEFLNALLLPLKPEYYKVVEETHKDGTPHLHAVVKWKNGYTKGWMIKKIHKIYPDPKIHDSIKVEACRSIKNCVAYTDKEDPDPLESGPFNDTRGNAGKLLKQKQQFAQSLGFTSYQQYEDHHQTEEEFIERNERAIHDTILLNIKNDEYVPNDFKFNKLLSKNSRIRNEIRYLCERLNIKPQ